MGELDRTAMPPQDVPAGRRSEDLASCSREPTCEPPAPLNPQQPDRTVTLSPPIRSHRGSAGPPARLARYRILRLLGESGMGSVYEAEQEQPHRTVALKVIKAGLVTPALLRRFEQELQALGRLQHQGIAQIYDAGTADTDSGPQPYFAMELIRGKTLLEYVDE